jgi:glycosyltransferase involved in cell wall biosynthesis
MGIYDNEYFADNVYGHLRALVERVGAPRGGVHLDVGCGFGRVAEALRDELGLVYVGLDLDGEALASLRERGFEAHECNLRNLPAFQAVAEKAIAGRPLSSLSILDTLEHLPEPDEMLVELRRLAGRAQCPLVVSVPNVGHRDLGFKLAFGRWDYTPAGLLDRTHLRFFTERWLEEVTHAAGWYEVAKLDVLLDTSDQRFPELHPALAEGTSLHRLLSQLRQSVDGTATTNQFVRAYLPGQPLATEGAAVATSAQRGPFLTIVTRTQGRRLETLRETLLSLSAQSDQDFEVIVVGHRLDLEHQLAVERVIEDLHTSMRSKTRLLKVGRGNRTAPLNEGFSVARGDYVAILDDDDFVFGNWVETFKELARKSPGRVLRTSAVSQTFEPVSPHFGSGSVRAITGFQQRWPKTFDFIDHIVANRTPGLALAFPRLAFTELNIRFDEALTTNEDWDFMLRTVSVCDIASSPEITSVYRQWLNAASSATEHPPEEWAANYEQILRKIERHPIVLPEGTLRRIRLVLLDQASARESPSGPPATLNPPRDFLALRNRAEVILTSRSWRITRPLRFVRRSEPTVEEVWAMADSDIENFLHRLEKSWSWRLTGIIRSTKRRFSS